MEHRLQNKKIAILATDGVEQAELLEPRKALDEQGAKTTLISPKKHKIKAWDMKEWGKEIPVDLAVDSANASEYDALLLPGGVMNPDRLRIVPKAVQFVREFFEAQKPVAAICHGPWNAGGSGRCPRPHNYIVAVAPDGHSQCGRELGGSGSGHGQRLGNQPKT